MLTLARIPRCLHLLEAQDGLVCILQSPHDSSLNSTKWYMRQGQRIMQSMRDAEVYLQKLRCFRAGAIYFTATATIMLAGCCAQRVLTKLAHLSRRELRSV